MLWGEVTICIYIYIRCTGTTVDGPNPAPVGMEETL